MQKAATRVDVGNPWLYQGDTIYMTVADSTGTMVSLIQSNYQGLGSGVVVDGLGFIFQDRGALFGLNTSEPDVYAPKKRPFHTIIPAFVMKNNLPFLSFGVMGGAFQPMGHVQILCNMIDFGMNVQEAGDAGRYSHDGSSEPTGEVMVGGGTVSLEGGISDPVKVELTLRGHKLQYVKGEFGGYQAIMYDAQNKVYWGASEMRKDGHAAGY